MDKAIIFGIYDFFSFHVGRTLLNKGIEVIGIHTSEIGEPSFFEEKRLEVGRNANFKELSLSELDTYREDDITKTTFILSLYDLYMMNTETILQNTTMTKLQQYIESNKNLTEILFLLPIQLLRSNESETLQTVIDQVMTWGKNNRFYYLPAIYGPWQPSTFMFQQALIAKLSGGEINVNKREWTGDVLFVDDAVEAILATREKSYAEDNVNFVIESGIEDYWFQCAAQLQPDKILTEGIPSDHIKIDKSINRVSAKRITEFNDSIEKQLEIVQRFI